MQWDQNAKNALQVVVRRFLTVRRMLWVYFLVKIIIL